MECLKACETELGEVVIRIGLTLAKEFMEAEVEKLAGPRYRHLKDRKWSRWGQEEGYVVMGGQKIGIPRPRIRSRDGEEGELETYRLFQQDGEMQ